MSGRWTAIDYDANVQLMCNEYENSIEITIDGKNLVILSFDQMRILRGFMDMVSTNLHDRKVIYGR